VPDDSTNPLREYFEANPGRLIDKWMHYFDVYHRHFERFRSRPVTLVEFGVFHGGSLQMWKHYFGPDARIVGVDIDPRCASLTEEQIEVRIGDQADRAFLESLRNELDQIDVVVDDGAHMLRHQLATFEEIFPAVSAEGVYLVEDLHTGYWPEYGGGYARRTLLGGHRRPRSFVEYSKDLVDRLNAWHSREPGSLAVDDFTRTARSIHYYDSVLVIEKGAVTKPESRRTGTPSFDDGA
jgi:23S rRNA U2552 (ribose-2'-O)-methylase RlmE/FtsJ